MSDNLRRYRAIRDALTRVSWQAHRHGCQALDHAGSAHQRDRGQQEHPTAQRRHQIPVMVQPESRVKRLTRWLDNERILEELYFYRMQRFCWRI